MRAMFSRRPHGGSRRGKDETARLQQGARRLPARIKALEGRDLSGEEFRLYACWQLSEKAWQAQIIGLAELNDWWAYHTFNSERSEAGFPDLVLLKPGRTVFVEVKRMGGELTPEQFMVLEMLLDNDQEAYAWWPDDEAEVFAVLMHGQRRAPW